MRTCIVIAVLALSLAGCSVDIAQDGVNEPVTGRVFGEPLTHAIFAPFQGEWHFEDRRFDPEPENIGISGGPDISINGHIIRFGSRREVRLCQTRVTDEGIECEGWHHEDIHDPGDMQRVDCKLRKNGGNLELHWRIVSFGGFSDDSIVAASDYIPPDRSKDTAVPPWWIETYSPSSAK